MRIEQIIPKTVRIITNKKSQIIRAAALGLPVGWPENINCVEDGQATHVAVYKLHAIIRIRNEKTKLSKT